MSEGLRRQRFSTSRKRAIFYTGVMNLGVSQGTNGNSQESSRPLIRHLLEINWRRGGEVLMIDDQLDVVEDNGVKYNRKYLEFIKAFAGIGKDSRIFPKKCRTCGREFLSFPEYIHGTNPRAHCLERYSVPLDANQTLQVQELFLRKHPGNNI